MRVTLSFDGQISDNPSKKVYIPFQGAKILIRINIPESTQKSANDLDLAGSTTYV